MKIFYCDYVIKHKEQIFSVRLTDEGKGYVKEGNLQKDWQYVLTFQQVKFTFTKAKILLKKYLNQ